jgi:hypothetical protein
MHPETEPGFTLSCPYCRGSAAPIDVTMQSGERTLRYVCSICQNSWTVTTRVPPTLPKHTDVSVRSRTHLAFGKDTPITWPDSHPFVRTAER